MATTLQQLQIAHQLLNLMYSTYSFTSSFFSPPFSSSSTSSSSSSSSSSALSNQELDDIEMSYLLKWMHMFFEADETETVNPYRQELFNLYMNIKSDYAGYKEHLRYNRSLWILPSYRQRNLSSLTHKIQSDIRMFHQALQLFAYMQNLNSNINKKNVESNKNECPNTETTQTF